MDGWASQRSMQGRAEQGEGGRGASTARQQQRRLPPNRLRRAAHSARRHSLQEGGVGQRGVDRQQGVQGGHVLRQEGAGTKWAGVCRRQCKKGECTGLR